MTTATAPNAKQNRLATLSEKKAENQQEKELFFLDIMVTDDKDRTCIRRYFTNENEKNYFLAVLKGEITSECL